MTAVNTYDVDGSDVPMDTIFEVLKNDRRRMVLECLKRKGGSATLSDLAEEIAAMENGKDVSQIRSQERKRVYVGLYQCHLPKMDESEVINFDSDRGTVEVGPLADSCEDYLDKVTGERDNKKFALLAAGCALTPAVAAVVGGPLLGVLVAMVLSIGVLVYELNN